MTEISIESYRLTFRASDRLAAAEADAGLVAGNSYAVAVDLDEEWTGTLYMRVRFGSYYYDVPFQSTDPSVTVQMPAGYPAVGLGVYSEALGICTSEARLDLLRSILEEGAEAVAFDGDLYEQWESGQLDRLTTGDIEEGSTLAVTAGAVYDALEEKADDEDVVHNFGNEEVAGIKTFTSGASGAYASFGMHFSVNSGYTSSADNSWKKVVDSLDRNRMYEIEVVRGYHSAVHCCRWRISQYASNDPLIQTMWHYGTAVDPEDIIITKDASGKFALWLRNPSATTDLFVVDFRACDVYRAGNVGAGICVPVPALTDANAYAVIPTTDDYDSVVRGGA